jgi:pyrroloquinoline quinone (PQQ) biosynthesis protein C
MVHVLEGMAVALASKAAASLRASLSVSDDRGFKYLTTHSDLDVKHAEFFEGLINQIGDRYLPLLIETTIDFYKLYGDLFRDLDARRGREPS